VSKRRSRVPRSFITRAVLSIVMIAVVMVVGIIGMNQLEGMSYLDAFYFMALLATGEGPGFTPLTVGGKLFAGVLAFVSVGTTVTALLFLFGPFFGSVIKQGWERVEEEVEKEKEKLEGRD